MIIKIPLIDIKLFINIGNEGLKEYNKQIKDIEEAWSNRSNVLGLQYTNHIYIENFNDNEVIFHEVTHFLEWLYEYIGCKDESEFKAYIGGYVIDKILKLKENKWQHGNTAKSRA